MKELNHIAIILDGNGRWAKAKGMPRSYGHMKGADNIEVISKACWNRNIKYMTVYAFSTENWKRPQEEVDYLMGLFRKLLKKSIKTCQKNNMRVRILGDKSRLPEDIQQQVLELEEVSKDMDGFQLQLAINYGGRDELVRAVKTLAGDVASGRLRVDEIDEDRLSNSLDTKEIPDPDLLIRTSGEQRLSNYLLWQLAYSEFYFTQVPWPAFSEEELDKAIEAYQNRDRRFGKV